MAAKKINYTILTTEDMEAYMAEAGRLNRGDGLRYYLERNGFLKELGEVYSHTDPPQVIELFSDKQGLRYINCLDENDNGRFIDFLRNRQLEPGKIVPNTTIHAFIDAVQIAQEQAAFRAKIPPPAKQSPPVKKCRKKGL